MSNKRKYESIQMEEELTLGKVETVETVEKVVAKYLEEAKEYAFFFSLTPGPLMSAYWLAILDGAFVSQDFRLLSLLTRSVCYDWIRQHLTFVDGRKYLLFLDTHPILTILPYEQWNLLKSSDVCFCICQSLIWKLNQEKIPYWIELLKEMKICFGYENTHIPRVVQHYLNQEKLIQESSLEFNPCPVRSPQLNEFEWGVIELLSHEIIATRRDSIYSPFCFSIASERFKWIPGNILSLRYALLLDAKTLELHERTILVNDQRGILSLENYLQTYQNYHLLLRREESSRIREVLEYLTSVSRCKEMKIERLFSRHRNLSFDVCLLHHPHVWMFWLELLVMETSVKTSMFRLQINVCSLFYQRQMEQIQKKFLSQLGEELPIAHVCLLKRREKSFNHRHCLKIPQFLEKWKQVECSFLEHYNLPSALWELISSYIV